VSALTQLTHEGPRSSVNFRQHVQPQSALSIWVVWAVSLSGRHRNRGWSMGWSRWTHIRPTICPRQAVLLSSTLPRFFIVKYIFRFRPKMAGFPFLFIFRLFLFNGRKSKIHFRPASSHHPILTMNGMMTA